MNRLNGVTLLIIADIQGVSKNLDRIQVNIKVEDNHPNIIIIQFPYWLGNITELASEWNNFVLSSNKLL